MVLSMMTSTVHVADSVKATTIENPSYQVAAVADIQSIDAEPIAVQSSVEEAVREYFKDTPILVKVAMCESTFRQFDKNGAVLRGIVDRDDVGVMQINEKYHGDQAQKANIDIYSLEGNMKFAQLLYNEQGTAPWSASQPCWSK